MTRNLMLALCLAAVATQAQAQNEASSLDRIEVTGSRISYRDLLDTPAISLTKPGDYLLQQITLLNDTRDKAARTKELHDTITRLLSAAGSRYRLLHGDAYRLTLTRDNHRVPIEDDEKRPDAGLVTLQVGVDVGSDPGKAEVIIADMRRFIEGADKVGRTEIDIVGDTALGMNRPERFRYELIEAIAKDSQRLMGAMALDCKVELEGLNSRIEWQRVSAAELLLYIPYSMAITDCSMRREG